MKIKMISLADLIISPANVRKTGSMNGIAELASSIEAHGLLQNLQVREGTTGKFEVVAGGRRLAALKLLAKKKALAKDAPVACHVIDPDDAAEISLAENEMRQAMHPADQFEAFKALIDAGQGIEDVAAKFGATPTVVRQRLKLASVSPTLMAIYRTGEMTLDLLMAFTVSDDHTAQEAAWFDAPDWQRSAHSIRHALTAQHVRADDWRARFVTVEAYAAAGGGVIADLFRKEGEGYLTDPALLDQLVNERLEAEAEIVEQEGWSWVEIMPETGFDQLRSYGELRGKREPMPPKQAKALAKAEREADKLREADELDDDEAERLEALEAEIATLSAHTYIWSDRQKARGGAILTITHDGKLTVLRGLIRPEDAKAKPVDDEPASEETGEQKASGLSAALADDLTAHRTAALRALLANNVAVALAASAHALALPLFYDSGVDSAFDLHAISPALRAEGIEDSPAVKSMSDQHAAWQDRLPEDEAALWDWLLAQDSAVIARLIAYCVASTVKPVSNDRTGQIAAALSLDMAQWWKPTVPGYLGRVPKPLIIEAVTEAKGANAAENIATLKKAEMAERAADILTGTNWLPPMLRAA